MIQIARWKIVLVLLTCLLGVVYAMPNVMGEARKSLPDWWPHQTVNLGLDLRGGAHLLYEVDVDVVLRGRADSILQDVRKTLREDKIGYSKLGSFNNENGIGVRVTLRDAGDGEAARKVLRGADSNLDVTADGLVQTAVLNEAGIKHIYDQTIAQSIEIVRRRVDELGTTEPLIARQGDDRILIQAPGTDAQTLKAIVGKTAKLNFHLVKDGGDSIGTKVFPYADDPAQKLSVESRPLISGDMLENAQPNFDQSGQPVISFRLNNTGARRFCDVTRDNVGKPFAIVLDNEVLSAPVIREAICGGSGQISGNFTVASANDLALLLRAGALPAPMSVVEERSVGPSLGADSIESGRKASMIGLALVLVFMALAYGLFGVMADVALLLNVCLIFALLSMIQATLTLPGIAGIVLTIGMAVDSNVLIFERIREEIRAGRSPISAIDTGYRTAMATIIDSNLTTLISAIVLFAVGTGPIKGFAVTLGIGLVTSYFSAIMVTRLMVVFWLRNKRPTELPL